MKIFRVHLEHVQHSYVEIEAESFDKAYQEARTLEESELEWKYTDPIEVVDVDELLPDDDD